MPTLSDKLRNIDTLRTTIEAHGKIPQEILRKIDYKFRLECNYHSNRIEGGTLTKLETRSVMVGNITVKDKPLKDIREMRGHDEVMQQILRMGKGELRLSEKRIKEIHKAIIKAEKLEDEEEIGVWKKEGNHIFNYQDERFEFTAPDKVPDAIHALLNWLNTGLDHLERNDKKAPDPLLLCFEFHLRYLTIHPFSDGNGRTARLLTNLVLVSLGYPPFWVSEGAEKDAYNRYLADVQSYGSSPDMLFDFMAGLMERSLLLVSDAVEGKEIEDMDDWKKKVLLLKNQLPEKDTINAIRSKEAVEEVYQNSIKPVISKIMHDMVIYDDLFLKKQMSLGTGGGSVSVQDEDGLDQVLRSNPPMYDIKFNYNLEGFRKYKEKQFHIGFSLIWKLENYNYSLHIEHVNPLEQFPKQYDEYYDTHEINEINRLCGEFMLQQIESNIEAKNT